MFSHGFNARAFAEELFYFDELKNVIVGAIRKALAPVVASHEAIKEELAPVKAIEALKTSMRRIIKD